MNVHEFPRTMFIIIFHVFRIDNNYYVGVFIA